MSEMTVATNGGVQSILENESLRQLIAGMKTLPSLPTLYRELMQELQSPNASLKKAGQIIAKDIGMVGKILQIVNSPFFGLRTRISSAEQAVALLGMNTIKSLVLSTKVFTQFEGSQNPLFSLEVLWNHAVATARFARAIAKEENAPAATQDDAFTAGLLHDVGILVLATNLPDQYTKAVALMQDQGLTECEAERAEIGASHAEVGGYLLNQWGLDDAIVEAVAFHHGITACSVGQFSILTAVYAANYFDEETGAECLGRAGGTVEPDYFLQCGCADKVPLWRAVCQNLTIGTGGFPS
jgi:HD-like signal output (HDOD) protein